MEVSSQVSTQNAFEADDHYFAPQKSFQIHKQPAGVWNQRYPFVVFLLIGTAQLYGWNAFMNSAYAVLNSLYGGESGPDDLNSITVASATMNFLFTCLCIRFTHFFARPVVTYAGLMLTGACSLFGAALLFADYAVSFYLLHVYGAIMGIGNAVVGCSTFGYANYFPSNYSGAASAGLGLSGMLSFAVWMLSRYVIFSDTHSGIIGACWLLHAVSALLTVVCVFIASRFFGLPWVRQIIIVEEREKVKYNERKYMLELGTAKQATKNNPLEQLKDEDEFHYDANLDDEPTESIIQTFKCVSLIAFLFFITMFVTFGTFPGIGPSHFNISQSYRDLTTGMFQLGDMIGRYVPNVVPFLLLKKTALTWAVLLRLLYLVIFLVIYALPHEQVFLNHIAFQVILFLSLSFTNGWVFSCCFIRIPEFVRSDVAKARCGAIALLLILFGITVAQWFDYGLVQLWVIKY